MTNLYVVNCCDDIMSLEADIIKKMKEMIGLCKDINILDLSMLENFIRMSSILKDISDKVNMKELDSLIKEIES